MISFRYSIACTEKFLLHEFLNKNTNTYIMKRKQDVRYGAVSIRS